MENSHKKVQNEKKSGLDVSIHKSGSSTRRRLQRMESFVDSLESVKELRDNAASGKLYLLHRMLNRGVEIDAQQDDDDDGSSGGGETALTTALNCGQKEAFRLLLKHGADPDIRPKPKIKASGPCNTSPLWKTINLQDLEWSRLLLSADYDATLDESTGGWVDALRRHLAEIKRRKKEEGVDLTRDPFNSVYSEFFEWYDTVRRLNPFSLAHGCRLVIRRRLKSLASGRSIFAAAERLPLPRTLRNYVLLQDMDTEEWLDEYMKTKAKSLERMVASLDKELEAEGREPALSHG